MKPPFEDLEIKTRLISFKDSCQEWWNRRTRLERGLVVALVVVFIICFAVFISIGVASVVRSYYTYGECTEDECMVAAAEMAGSLDHSVKPCDNFYDFACGGWIKANIPNQKKPLITKLNKLQDTVYDILNGLFEEHITTYDIKVVGNLKQFYSHCIHIDDTTAALRYLKQTVDTHLGGWPILGSKFDESKWKLEDRVAALSLLDHGSLFKTYVAHDTVNTQRNTIKIKQPDFKYVVTNSEQKKKYKEMIKQFLSVFNTAIIEKDIKGIEDFKEALSGIITPEPEPEVHVRISELQKDYPQINWLNHFLKFLEIAKIEVHATEEIVNNSPKYFKQLMKLIEQTPKRTLQNYMVWDFMESLARDITPELENTYRHFTEVLPVKSEADWEPRNRYCTDVVLANLRHVAGRMFVKHSFDSSSKVLAIEMASSIRGMFKSMLMKEQWMDESTLNSALKKMQVLGIKTGYPSLILDAKELNRLYEKYEYNNRAHLTNTIVNRRTKVSERLQNLRGKNSGLIWSVSSATADAHYNLENNGIDIPAGILQPPLYSKFLPRYMNFGAVGFIVAQQLTHGFDNVGRHYDKMGSRKRWWSSQALKLYKPKAQCVIDQYAKFTDPVVKTNINATLTLDENIADSGGLKISYKAYKKWLHNSGSDIKLPGQKYNNEQLFFISYAQTLCASSTPERANVSLNDAYSPNRFRVIGSLQNSEEFSQVFQCAEKSYMNPTKKCGLW